jgi:hypothetical protein
VPHGPAELAEGLGEVAAAQGADVRQRIAEAGELEGVSIQRID